VDASSSQARFFLLPCAVFFCECCEEEEEEDDLRPDSKRIGRAMGPEDDRTEEAEPPPLTLNMLSENRWVDVEEGEPEVRLL